MGIDLDLVVLVHRHFSSSIRGGGELLLVVGAEERWFATGTCTQTQTLRLGGEDAHTCQHKHTILDEAKSSIIKVEAREGGVVETRPFASKRAVICCGTLS